MSDLQKYLDEHSECYVNSSPEMNRNGAWCAVVRNGAGRIVQQFVYANRDEACAEIDDVK